MRVREVDWHRNRIVIDADPGNHCLPQPISSYSSLSILAQFLYIVIILVNVLYLSCIYLFFYFMEVGRQIVGMLKFEIGSNWKIKKKLYLIQICLNHILIKLCSSSKPNQTISKCIILPSKFDLTHIQLKHKSIMH